MFAFYIFIQISNYTRAEDFLFPIERLQIRLLVSVIISSSISLLFLVFKKHLFQPQH